MPEEIVEVVDENNVSVREEVRSKVRKNNLRHRATYIFVFTKQASEVPDVEDLEMIVQKRTLVKDYCPGYWDVCTGGVLSTGETYFPSAIRELEEEIGLKSSSAKENDKVQLKDFGTFLYEDHATRVWGGLFTCVYKGSICDLKLQESEVDKVEIMSIREVKTRSKNEKFTPDSMVALEKIIECLKTPKMMVF